MPFWTTQRIREALKGENPPILKPNFDYLNNACYELALGAEAFITSTADTKCTYKLGEQVRIPPGQLALLITEEELCIPLNILAFISIKASKKISGLVMFPVSMSTLVSGVDSSSQSTTPDRNQSFSA